MTEDFDLENMPPLGAVEVDGEQVQYNVWAVVEAVVKTDKGEKRIPRLVGPVKLHTTTGLFDAMSVISLACELPEYQVGIDELIDLAPDIARKIENKEIKWE
jgi:hypothetical protein